MKNLQNLSYIFENSEEAEAGRNTRFKDHEPAPASYMDLIRSKVATEDGTEITVQAMYRFDTKNLDYTITIIDLGQWDHIAGEIDFNYIFRDIEYKERLLGKCARKILLDGKVNNHEIHY